MEMQLSFGEKVLLNIFRVLTTVLGAMAMTGISYTIYRIFADGMLP
jgi:hypothetical protein